MKTILVVDDERDIVNTLKARLEANQYKVLTAYDGDEGLKSVDQENPDLIILDIGMPKMDGYTFVRELRSNDLTSRIPVVILTAKDRLQDIFKLEGVKDYIVKPYDSADLLSRVKKILGE
ncbi:MAG: response regulator [Candidatus Omnitrophota bacterium]